MKRNLLYGGIFLIVVLIAGVAYMLRPSTEASAPIEAVPLAISTETAVPEAAPAATQETETPTDEAEVSAEQGGTVVYVISQQIDVGLWSRLVRGWTQVDLKMNVLHISMEMID